MVIAFQDGFHFIHEDQIPGIGCLSAVRDSNAGAVNREHGVHCDLQTGSFCCLNLKLSLLTVALSDGKIERINGIVNDIKHRIPIISKYCFLHLSIHCLSPF